MPVTSACATPLIEASATIRNGSPHAFGPGSSMLTAVLLTVSVAASEIDTPPLFENTARKRLLLSAAAAIPAKWFVVAPAMFVNDTPFVDTCHCTVGFGV